MERSSSTINNQLQTSEQEISLESIKRRKTLQDVSTLSSEGQQPKIGLFFNKTTITVDKALKETDDSSSKKRKRSQFTTSFGTVLAGDEKNFQLTAENTNDSKMIEVNRKSLNEQLNQRETINIKEELSQKERSKNPNEKKSRR